MDQAVFFPFTDFIIDFLSNFAFGSNRIRSKINCINYIGQISTAKNINESAVKEYLTQLDKTLDILVNIPVPKFQDPEYQELIDGVVLTQNNLILYWKEVQSKAYLDMDIINKLK